jgi:hypothetical protein
MMPPTIVFAPAFPGGSLGGLALLPRVFSPMGWLMLSLFIFSLWVPLLLQDLMLRRWGHALTGGEDHGKVGA